MSIEVLVIIILLFVNVGLVCWCMLLDSQLYDRKGYIVRLLKENDNLRSLLRQHQFRKVPK